MKQLLVLYFVSFFFCFVYSLDNITEQDTKSIAYSEYKFTARNKHSSNEDIQILIKLNGTKFTMETNYQYNNYIYTTNDSNLIQYKYYKNCVLSYHKEPIYTLYEHYIIVVLTDSNDISSYSFKLDKKWLSPNEKIDIMFNTMSVEIADLKKRTWFIDPLANKVEKNRVVQTYGSTLIKLLNGEKPHHSGECSECYSFDRDYGCKKYPLVIGFPVDVNFRRVVLEFKITSCLIDEKNKYKTRVGYAHSYVRLPGVYSNEIYYPKTNNTMVVMPNGSIRSVMESEDVIVSKFVIVNIINEGPGGMCNYDLTTLEIF